MQLIVCIKQSSNRIVKNAAADSSNMNPCDRNALEAALNVKSRCEDSNITAVSMGPKSAEEVLRETLTYGVDEAVIVTDEAYKGSDTLVTAQILTKALKQNITYDLIICGCHSIDGDTGQVGPEMAEMLGTAYAGFVTKIKEVTEKFIICEKKTDTGIDIVKLKYPALITILDDSNCLRNRNFRDIIKASKKEIKILTNNSLELLLDECGTRGSATQIKAIQNISAKNQEGKIVVCNKENIEQILDGVFEICSGRQV